jgi:hypothetical protein
MQNVSQSVHEMGLVYNVKCSMGCHIIQYRRGPKTELRTSLNVLTIVILNPFNSNQIKQEACAVAQHCGAEVCVTALLGENTNQLKRAVATAGHVVVSTPGG